MVLASSWAVKSSERLSEVRVAEPTSTMRVESTAVLSEVACSLLPEEQEETATRESAPKRRPPSWIFVIIVSILFR